MCPRWTYLHNDLESVGCLWALGIWKGLEWGLCRRSGLAGREMIVQGLILGNAGIEMRRCAGIAQQ